ncbi:DUF6640 family protein, partial [Nocardia brasiliensis]|uniref:DUF6640 family protein n=1 Tax=Nocardia brasiliensis TaxID=37326 RepID=UPI0024554343
MDALIRWNSFTRKAGAMPFPRIVIAVVAVITMLSAVLADLVIPDSAAQHAFNPNWPPHAKFHDAQYMVMTVLLGLVGLVLALRPGRDTRRGTLCAPAVVAQTWGGIARGRRFAKNAGNETPIGRRTLLVGGSEG